MMLDESALTEAAVARHGLDNLGDEDLFRPGLSALLASLRDEAALSQPGMWRTIPRLMNALTRRTLIVDALARDASVREVPVEAPIFIVGFPRTGTTLLHNLLGADPANRAPRLWELAAPVTPPDVEGDVEAALVSHTAMLLQMARQVAPDLEKIHPMAADAPDECSWLFRNSFATMVLALASYVPGYVDWLVGLPHADRVAHYRDYRLQLQLILARRPGDRLVVKDPCHLWHLDALLEVFPDARIVHLHRDPAEVLPSLCSLCTALHGMDSDAVDPGRMGAYATKLIDTALDGLTRARDALAQARVLHVPYRELVADPVGRALAIEQWAGRAVDDRARQAMQTWLDENRQHKKGRHVYTAEQFGLNPAAIRERYADYIARHLD